MEKNEIKVYVVSNARSRINKDIIIKIESYYRVKFYFISYDEFLDTDSGEKIHLLIFDGIDMDEISYSKISEIQVLNKSLHTAAIIENADEEAAIKVYENHIDYLFNKEYSNGYFIAKLRSILKRKSSKYQIENNIVLGELKIDLLMNEAYFDNKIIDTTKLELRLLKVLVRADDYITKDELYKKVWKYGDKSKDETRVLDQLIHRIRNKFPDLKITTDRKYGIKIAK